MGDLDQGVVSWNQIVARGRGEYFVSHAMSPGQIQVFGATGEFRRTIGEEGLGPTEFRGITSIRFGPDGNLWVHDGGNRALKIVTTTGDVIVSQRADFSVSRNGMLVLDDGSLILNALVPSRDLIGLWTHRWRPGSGFTWSVDDGNPTARGYVEQRVYAVGGGYLWVAPRWGEYRIEKRSLETGELVEEFVLRRDWFDGFQDEIGGAGVGDDVGLVRPRATISDLQFTDGRLWVLGYTPDRNWRRATADGYRDLGVLLDTVLEVLSPDGRLLMSARLDLDRAFGSAFVAPGWFVAHESGEVMDRAVVYEIRMRGPVPR
ncbi:MAG: hypothetical protein RQ751_09250 [Longimicrobiales bacterium]|nr:hypothetical protein [Longimicrobiales bacterium]